MGEINKLVEEVAQFFYDRTMGPVKTIFIGISQ